MDYDRTDATGGYAIRAPGGSYQVSVDK